MVIQEYPALIFTRCQPCTAYAFVGWRPAPNVIKYSRNAFNCLIGIATSRSVFHLGIHIPGGAARRLLLFHAPLSHHIH